MTNAPNLNRVCSAAPRCAILLTVGMLIVPAADAFAEQAPSTAASSVIPSPRPTEQTVNEHFNLTGSTLLELQIDAEPTQPVTVTVPINGADYTLDLEPYSLRDAGYQLLVQIDDGSLVATVPGPERTLRGAAAEAPGSFVAGSLLHNGLNVAISLPGVEGRYWLEPLAGEIDGAGPRDYALFHDSDRLPIGSCGVNLDFLAAEPADGDFDPLSAGGGVAGIEQTCTWEAQIACDSDYEYYQDNGSSVDNVEAKITNIINVMNEEYERDVQIRHLITTILVRSSVNDPYSNTTNAETLLSEFRNVWNSTQSGIQRDVAHMFTGRNVSGDVIGIAYTTNICTSNAYGLVEDISGLSFQTDLSAHELGHNWSANHCNCPQNTMNAFLGSIAYNQFHPTFTVPEIVAYRNSRSFCLNNVCIPDNDNCDSPVIILGQGSKSFNSTNATTDGPEEPGACDDSGFAQLDKDVWYWLLSDCNQTIRVSTCGSQFDTKLAIYETFCPTGPGELIACNDNACGSASEVTFNGTADAIYRIRVGGVNGASGSGVVTVTCESAPTCPADTNGDAVIDVTDLVNVIVTWGTTSPVGDITGDGNVDVSDLVQIIVNWGPCA